MSFAFKDNYNDIDFITPRFNTKTFIKHRLRASEWAGRWRDNKTNERPLHVRSPRSKRCRSPVRFPPLSPQGALGPFLRAGSQREGARIRSRDPGTRVRLSSGSSSGSTRFCRLQPFSMRTLTPTAVQGWGLGLGERQPAEQFRARRPVAQPTLQGRGRVHRDNACVSPDIWGETGRKGRRAEDGGAAGEKLTAGVRKSGLDRLSVQSVGPSLSGCISFLGLP